MTSHPLSSLFSRRTPLIQIVLDGWGMGTPDEHNAIACAKHPHFDFLFNHYPSTQLNAHGPFVGLPSLQDLGGSEVGHLTMGAGQILEQGPTEIKRLMASGEFFKSPVLQTIIQNCLEHHTPLHLLGLLSDGNIHSHIDHFIALIHHAFDRGVEKLYVHALLDGRDVAIQSAIQYTSCLESLFRELTQQRPTIDYAFASAGGREVITMDRDQDWSKIQAGWEIHVHGKSQNTFESIESAVLAFRSKQPHLIDQAIPGFVITRDGKPVGPIQDDHSVIFMNFRGDRAIQMAQAFVEDHFPYFDRGIRPRIQFAGMKIYDQDTNLPPQHLIGPTHVESPFGKRILEKGWRQFRLAETQKYAHVTFFYNGGYREPLDPLLENYYLIHSDHIPSFDAKPQMQAFSIARKAVQLILSGQYEFGLINFANPDMVGHSGSMEATIQAVETVDHALKWIMDAVRAVSGILVITADHGNADQMESFNNQKQCWEPNTKHTLNPVPFIIYDPLYKGQYQLKSFTENPSLSLSQIASTNFILLGQAPPSDLDDPLFC